MAKNEITVAESKRRAIIRHRTRLAREAAGWGQLEMATALGRSLSAYKKYEAGRDSSVLPTTLLGPFCKITGADLQWLTNSEELHRHQRHTDIEEIQKPKKKFVDPK